MKKKIKIPRNRLDESKTKYCYKISIWNLKSQMKKKKKIKERNWKKNKKILDGR